MTDLEYFRKRWEAEQRAFLAVLRALPADKLDYRPHERSTSAGDLAWQLTDEQGNLSELIDTGVADWQPKPRPATLAEIVSLWEKATEAARGRIMSLDEEKAATPAEFRVGGAAVWNEPLGHMLWGYIFDMVHHRGQLSSYIRPMGGKVPSIYGPSGDDQGS